MSEKGLVIKSISGEYTVLSNEKKYICKPRGVFRYNTALVKVGDNVLFDKNDLVITKVLERKNDLIRPVIANVDKVFLVTSIKEPDLNLNLLDKMLCLLEYNNIEPILIFSKNDLVNVKDSIYDIIDYYKQIGYKVFVTSINEYNEEIIDEIKDCICVAMGQSGVGKSTLLNNLNKELNIETNEISKALGRGKHTTRHIELYEFNGGFLADSPGFGSLDFDEEMDVVTLSQTFKEFFELSSECKFNTCTHINEPGCKIKEQVEKGNILKSRYNNYLTFVNELKNRKKKY